MFFFLKKKSSEDIKMSFNYLPKRVSSYYNFELLIKLQINNLMLWIKRLTIIIITTENYENLFISIDLQYNSVIKHFILT